MVGSLWTEHDGQWRRQAVCIDCEETYTVVRAARKRRIPTRCKACIRERGRERERRHRARTQPPPVCVDCGGEPERGPSGRRCLRCESCQKAVRLKAQYTWRDTHPEQWAAVQGRHQAKRRTDPEMRLRRRAGMLFRMYGITPERYIEMETEQGQLCAICRKPPRGKPTGKSGEDPEEIRFHVDHDHGCCPGKESCGKCVRGLLCGNCNTMIGLAGENPIVLMAAVEYLQKG